MEENYPRRLFLGKTLLAATGLICVPTGVIANEIGSKSAPLKGYAPYTGLKTDLRTSFLGKEVLVAGKIYNADGKSTIPNALIEVWHLSPEKNIYEHHGKMYTDYDGRYQFITDWPNREQGKQYRIYFKVSKNRKSVFTELIFNQSGAHISDKHWEKNQQLAENLLFPSIETFLNRSTINFNFTINH
jgi:protocatechuate 3,4-dioxygenase beta subunit|tara:strand:- start:7784 stop:8344 length:561 start_codon:yes stop_codon:yes gene_type:complete